MLQKMRDNTQGWVTKLIITIICLVFIVWGLEKMIAPGGGNGREIIKVNGKSITQQQYYNALQVTQSRLSQTGVHSEPSALHKQVVDHLIEQAVLSGYAKDHSFFVPESEIDTFIVSMPAFQTGGKFDEQRFMSLVNGSNMTPMQFKENLRGDMELSQLQNAITNSAFVTSRQADELTRLQDQTRNFSFAELSIGRKIREQKVSDKEIESYYEQHKAEFMSDEKVSVSYILLKQNELSRKISIPETEITTAYENYRTEEQSNIKPQIAIIKLKVNSSHTSKQQLAKAKQIKEKLKKGSDFAKLASQYSDDVGSRKKAGVISDYAPGHFGYEFDDAVDLLKPGQVSEPVDTQQGIYIIKRTDDGKAHVKPLDQMRETLVAKLQKKQAASFFQGQIQKLADLSFENTDLATPAKTLGVSIKTTDFFTRKQGKGITSNKKFVAAAFSDEVTKDNNNSDVVNISPEEVAVLHLKEFQPSHQMKLSAVREKIVTLLKDRKAKEAMITDAGKAVASLESGTSRTAFAKAHDIHWKEIKKAGRKEVKGVSPEVLKKAFSLPHPASGKTSYGWLTLSTGNVAIVAVSKVIPGEVSTKKDDSHTETRQDMVKKQGEGSYRDFVRTLKDQAEITMLDTNLGT